MPEPPAERLALLYRVSQAFTSSLDLDQVLNCVEVRLARGDPGDRERAQDLLREAEAIFTQIGTPYYVNLVQDRLQTLAEQQAAGREQ